MSKDSNYILGSLIDRQQQILENINLLNSNLNSLEERLNSIETIVSSGSETNPTPVDPTPEKLFENKSDMSQVLNGLGNIHTGKTVGDVRDNYNNIEEVVAQILRIEVPTEIKPQAKNISISWDTNDKIKFNTQYQNVTFTAVFNTGSWLDAYNSDGITPYNGHAENSADSVTFTFSSNFIGIDPLTFSVNKSIGNDNIFTHTINNQNTNKFDIWDNSSYTVTVQIIPSSTPDTDIIVFSKAPHKNQYKNPAAAARDSGESLPIYTETLTFMVFKPVFIDYGNGNGPVETTDQIFSNTNVVTLTNFSDSHKVYVPFQPTRIDFFTVFPVPGYEEDNIERNWDITPADLSVLSNLGSYWEIKSKVNQEPNDFKLIK